MKHAQRIESAIQQIRKELGCKNEMYSPAQNDDYWKAVQKAEKDFDVSGVKLDRVIQCLIK